MQASEALEREQEQLRQDLVELQQRMRALGRSLQPGSAMRSGWFERAQVVEDLVASIPPAGRPVSELAWKLVPRDEV